MFVPDTAHVTVKGNPVGDEEIFRLGKRHALTRGSRKRIAPTMYLASSDGPHATSPHAYDWNVTGGKPGDVCSAVASVNAPLSSSSSTGPSSSAGG